MNKNMTKQECSCSDCGLPISKEQAKNTHFWRRRLLCEKCERDDIRLESEEDEDYYYMTHN